ncbi:MAG: carbohydrate ABC transporter permease [Anaerolineae bacterium]|nr:carbohydrate ABC transporter permease [Anaerolineae bacterium]MDW8100499.1 carbohydrate ABC transporter permease [Anaerolineae bacterium]
MATVSIGRRRRSWQRIVRRAIRQAFIYTLLSILGMAILLPFLWTLSSSLKPPGAGIKFPPEFIPRVFVWDNYPHVFRLIPFLTFFKNSVIVTSLAVIGEVLSASLVAYSFARLRFPGRDVLFVVVLATMMIPYPVTMVPTFIMFKLLHLVNTFLPLVLPPYFGPAFSIFLLRQFFLTINLELDEAAKVDGASEFLIYRRIILPLSKPALATVAIFSFMYNWNDFLNPLIYLSDSNMYTLALGVNYLRSFRGGGELSLQMAASVMFVAPCILLFFLAQRFIVQGIVTTGLKG